MSKNKSQVLLVLGCQRSGTTLLAAMLGGHSEINMLFESQTKDVLKLIGKKYSGNKLLTWRQVRMNSRSSKFGHLLNRMANLDYGIRKNRPHKLRISPSSALSIKDYIANKAKVVSIIRNKEEVISSIMNRTEMNRKQAEKEYDYSVNLMNSVEDSYKIDFSDLVNKPVETLKGICQYLNLEYEERMLQGTEYNFVYPNKNIVKERSNAPNSK